MARRLERVEARRVRRVAIGGDGDERAVAAVLVRARPSGSSTTGSAPLPCLPVLSATSCSIHRPSARATGAAPPSACRGPSQRRCADERAELEAGVLRGSPAGSPPPCRRRRRAVSRAGAADERGGDEAEQRQRREAPADVRRVDEHLAVAARLARAASSAVPGIGDGDEVASGRVAERRATCAPRRTAPSTATSTVPPLLLATRNSVRAGSSAAARRVMVGSSVVSRTYELREALARRRRPRAGPRRRGCCRPCRAGRPRRSLRHAARRARHSVELRRHRLPTSSQPRRLRSTRVGAVRAQPQTPVRAPRCGTTACVQEPVDEVGRGSSTDDMSRPPDRHS